MEDGYQWKFDDTIFDKLGFSHMTKNQAFELKCNLGIIYGTESNMMTDEILNFMRENVPKGTPMLAIERLHIMFCWTSH